MIFAGTITFESRRFVIFKTRRKAKNTSERKGQKNIEKTKESKYTGRINEMEREKEK